jgi:hypothetical protein
MYRPIKTPPQQAEQRNSSQRITAGPVNGTLAAKRLQPRTPGTEATPRRRPDEQPYLQLRERIVDLVHLTVPRGSTMLVVSKGDEDLVDISGRKAWHFPRAINGLYAGCYPADSREAIEHLGKLRTEGAAYLVIPSPSFWWLEYYRGLTRHLQRRHRLIAYHEELCLVFKLLNIESEGVEGCLTATADEFRS